MQDFQFVPCEYKCKISPNKRCLQYYTSLLQLYFITWMIQINGADGCCQNFRQYHCTLDQDL